MELLQNPLLETIIKSDPTFSLHKSNQKFDIIKYRNDVSISSLETIFDNIRKNKKIENSYYFLRQLCINAGTNDLLKIIIKITETKIMNIKEAIKLSNVNIITYNQIWTDYVEFNKQIYKIMKVYREHLVTKNISAGKMSFSILEIIQLCIFYKTVLKDSEKKFLALDESQLCDLDQKNIDQLIDYISSLRIFIQMQNFTNVNIDIIMGMIRDIMSHTHIINVLCLYVHRILNDLNMETYPNKFVNKTVNLSQIQHTLRNKLYKIISILSMYADPNKLFICYRKFMQARITDLTYTKLDTEIQLIRRLSGLVGRINSQKLMDSISDIIYSRSFAKNLRNSEIKTVSNTYLQLGILPPNNIFNPVILTKNNWQISNISDIEPTYPLRIKYCLDIISKLFSITNENKYYVQWQPTLGSAKFIARLGSREINITCNFLQAVALEYLNENSRTNIDIKKFSSDTCINEKLSDKIIESLLNANLIHQLHKDDYFFINFNNYTGDSDIDIRQDFIDTFNTSNVTDVTDPIEPPRNLCISKNYDMDTDSD